MDSETLLHRLRTALNRRLDRLVDAGVPLRGRAWCIFVFSGAGAGILGTAALAWWAGHSPWVAGGVSFAAGMGCLALALFAKVITGEERYTFYHYQLFVIGAAALLLWALGQPILTYLDLVVLALGTTLASGRAGCLVAGCCHGRPHPWGICYREAHAYAGFTPCYVGVRLFPAQALELLWVAGVVVAGAVLVLTGHPPGTALAWYVVGYAGGRFFLEFIRGDAGRPYRWGFSEAQWTSLLLAGVVVGAALFGVLPLRAAHVGAAAVVSCMLAAMVLSALVRQADGHGLFWAGHLQEVAEAVHRISAQTKRRHPTRQIRVMRTSLGVLLSGEHIERASEFDFHYTLSREMGTMNAETAQSLARLILRVKHTSGSSKLIDGQRGVFHVLVRY